MTFVIPANRKLKETIMIDVTKATAAELVNYYNANSGKAPIKKFANRKTAEKRVASLLPAKNRKQGNGTPRSAVKADGTEYRSVKQAFEKLKLPLGRHIRFRMALKAAGKLAFEHGDKKINFAVINA